MQWANVWQRLDLQRHAVISPSLVSLDITSPPIPIDVGLKSMAEVMWWVSSTEMGTHFEVTVNKNMNGKS